MLESNSFAPVVSRADFEEILYLEGEALGRLAAEDGRLGFGRRMGELCDWELVPILVCSGGAAGPCDHGFFEELTSSICQRLAQAQAEAPIDGVFIFGHGAGITTELHDMDGPYFSAVREVVGPDVPIVAELDLHANISLEMMASVDIQVGYRCNPHTDVDERSVECAELLHEMLEGMRPEVAFVRVPLVAPTITQLTAAGQPLGELMSYAESKIEAAPGPIANVSILSGFAFSDTPDNGMAILVTARGDRAAAESLALDIARRAWDDRHRYVPRMISVEEAAGMAVEAGKATDAPPLALADCADNPGGGGRGNTTRILRALHESGAQGVVAGVFFDPPLVRDAQAAGVNKTFTARFNQEETEPSSEPFEVEARVVGLRDEPFRGRFGLSNGQMVNLGAGCLLELGGVTVAVASIRRQTLGPDHYEHFGVDVDAARTFLIKSRGHFRAGFDHLVPGDRIKEVDGPGLASPNLSRSDWHGLPRPIYPLDPEMDWTPRLS